MDSNERKRLGPEERITTREDTRGKGTIIIKTQRKTIKKEKGCHPKKKQVTKDSMKGSNNTYPVVGVPIPLPGVVVPVPVCLVVQLGTTRSLAGLPVALGATGVPGAPRPLAALAHPLIFLFLVFIEIFAGNGNSMDCFIQLIKDVRSPLVRPRTRNSGSKT